MDDPAITKDDLISAYKMAQKYFQWKQRDIILRLLTRKTLFNNQVPHVYGENLPPWFNSVHCNKYFRYGLSDQVWGPRFMAVLGHNKHTYVTIKS